MSIINSNPLLEKDYFDETLQACIDTLNRNKDKIYELMLYQTSEVNITLNFRPDEVVNMDINFNKLVCKNEEIENIKVEGDKNEKIRS